jgi:glucose/arabinose dehydrogenase
LARARHEIWAYGLRNPWRFSFDRATGALWCADVGQDRWEEIHIIEKGKNHGWNLMEGRHCFNPPRGCKTAGLVMPIQEYGRSDGISVTGGFVYRGKALPELVGAYIYGDYGSGRIWSLRVERGVVTEDRLLADTRQPISSFGEDEVGEIYVVLHGGGIAHLWRAPAGR